MTIHDKRVLMHDYLIWYQSKNPWYTEKALKNGQKYYKDLSDEEFVRIFDTVHDRDFRNFVAGTHENST